MKKAVAELNKLGEAFYHNAKKDPNVVDAEFTKE